MHGAGEVDGEIQLAEVWESEDYARRFDEDLIPTLSTLGTPLPSEVTIIELHHLVTP